MCLPFTAGREVGSTLVYVPCSAFVTSACAVATASTVVVVAPAEALVVLLAPVVGGLVVLLPELHAAANARMAVPAAKKRRDGRLAVVITGPPRCRTAPPRGRAHGTYGAGGLSACLSRTWSQRPAAGPRSGPRGAR